MALACPASAPARPYKPEQRYRLWHAFEFMDAALFRDEQTGDLALNLRCDYDGARFR
jgi:hypothetical protein